MLRLYNFFCGDFRRYFVFAGARGFEPHGMLACTLT